MSTQPCPEPTASPELLAAPTAETAQAVTGRRKPRKLRLNPQRRKAEQLERAQSTGDVIDTTAPSPSPNGDANAQVTSLGDGLPKQRPGLAKAKTGRSTGNVKPSSEPSPKPTPDSRPRLPKSKTLPVQEIRQHSHNSTELVKQGSRRKPQRTQSDSLALMNPAAVTGGLVGCAASSLILLGTHFWHAHSGPDSALLAARSAVLCTSNLLAELSTSLQHGTYSGDESLDILHRTTLAYASSIPGGARFIERLFLEVNMVRKQRGREVDSALRETYSEMANAAMRGASSDEIRDVLLGQLVKLSRFAGQSVQDVVARNPGLRKWRDGAVRSLGGAGVEDRRARGGRVPIVRLNMAVRHKVS